MIRQSRYKISFWHRLAHLLNRWSGDVVFFCETPTAGTVRRHYVATQCTKCGIISGTSETGAIAFSKPAEPRNG